MALVVLSVVEQRLDAVRAVRGWQSVVDVAAQVGVSRSTLHRWVGRYLEGSVAGLADRSHRPGLVSAPDRRLGRGRGGGDPAEASALGATPIRSTHHCANLAAVVSLRQSMSMAQVNRVSIPTPAFLKPPVRHSFT